MTIIIYEQFAVCWENVHIQCTIKELHISNNNIRKTTWKATYVSLCVNYFIFCANVSDKIVINVFKHFYKYYT